jgi:lambda repressor-like predicted transcriptional regulator
MKKILAILAAGITAATLSFTASAHGPSPQKVVKEIVIKAEPAKVWAVVKQFENLEWHPAIASTKVTKKGEDTFRALTLKDGGVINEKLRTISDEDMKIKYEIVDGVAPVADYYSYIKVTAGPNAGESTVKWWGRFYRVYKLNPPIPEGQDDESALNFVNTVYDTGLANLKKVLENSK